MAGRAGAVSPSRSPQRYTGTFSDNGKTIAGCWEKAENSSTWDIDFDLTYRKVG